ncbi:MerR family transcriptional regulator [Mobiluncus holmesii]|uniref:MerR family transcriptional regulator n=2 Tax=Actinomycetaceae TaxID=2049 RepID=A0A7K0K060_9ACTO|nr:MerR family transcriptional regulator [Mobiluncus porci]MST48843.1 MerR family transcriptional regulator [Mobiluncus porci]
MSISRVQELVSTEFPSVSQAKLRLLEKHGIVDPARRANGYRGYSEADVERIRYALRQQRDSYLPLDKIGENLAMLDRGEDPIPTEPVARMVSNDGEVVLPKTSRVTVRQIMDYTAVSAESLDKMVTAKLISPDLSTRFSPRAIEVVRALMQLEQAGIEPRNLRAAKSSANAAVDLIDKVVGPKRAKNTAAAKDRARQDAYDLAQILSSLIEALILQGVEELS